MSDRYWLTRSELNRLAGKNCELGRGREEDEGGGGGGEEDGDCGVGGRKRG